MPTWFWLCGMKITRKAGNYRCDCCRSLGRWDGGQSQRTLAEEYSFLREDLLFFTYLHMAAAPELADAMVSAKTTGVAYERCVTWWTIATLVPMSEVAGRMAVHRCSLPDQTRRIRNPPRWGARCSQRKHHRRRGRWNPRGSYRLGLAPKWPS